MQKKEKTKFNVETKTTVGIERERFITRLSDGMIVPVIQDLLPVVQKAADQRGIPQDLFGYELFAGQIEDRTPPCQSLEDLSRALMINDQILEKVAYQNGLGFDFSEFVEDFAISELVVNPFNRRHQEIWESISRERRLTASQVAAIHVHIAVPDIQVAINLLNLCDEKTINRLIGVGDHSCGKRITAYRTMSQSQGIPPKFSTSDALLGYIAERGGERNVWDLVRYKPKTRTVEFRMFGTTKSIEEIIRYTEQCLDLYKSLIQ